MTIKIDKIKVADNIIFNVSEKDLKNKDFADGLGEELETLKDEGDLYLCKGIVKIQKGIYCYIYECAKAGKSTFFKDLVMITGHEETIIINTKTLEAEAIYLR